jgi:glycosyltransferase involved in cell wall biosynthesis
VIKFRRIFSDPFHHQAYFGHVAFGALLAGNYDAAHALGVPDALAAVRARRLGRLGRSVYTQLGLPWREWWERQREASSHNKIVKYLDVYGCMSRYAVAMLEREYGRPGVWIPGGVSLADFRPAPRRAERPTLLFSGAIAEPRKNVALLLEALELVAKAEPEVELWLSGPGEAGPLLAGRPPAVIERVRLLGVGTTQEQPDRYGRAWAKVLPSRFDSFGQALVEALASGTPVVASDDGALLELVHDGAGVAFRAGDAEDLASACVVALKLARDPQTAARCRAVAEPFDWVSGLAPQLERIYGAGDSLIA